MNTVLVKSQTRTLGPVFYTERGQLHGIVAEVRHDDECGNGHNTFAITGTIYSEYRHPGETTIKTPTGKTLWCCGGGCCHDEIAKHFPELAHLIKWHLTSTDGPLHYIANTVYHAGDRDCWGLRKGEFRQHTSRGRQNNGVEGVPNWELRLPALNDVYSVTKPEPVTLEWQPVGKIGEGKVRDLEAARRCAVWPEATDEELTSDNLKERLMERHAALMAAFQRDVEAFGFTF